MAISPGMNAGAMNDDGETCGRFCAGLVESSVLTDLLTRLDSGLALPD